MESVEPTPSERNTEEKTMLTSDKICLRHPWFRMYCTLHIIVCDFFIYGEDPIVDSEVGCTLPFAGNVISMMFGKYPWASAPGFAALKLILFLGFGLAGIIVGRQILHHWLLRDTCKLKMFKGDKGTFLCMPICFAIFVYIGSMLYNATIPPELPPITPYFGMNNRNFGKFAQCCTWLGDLSTVVMVWDAMFQDYDRFPNWAARFKETWNHGCGGIFRVVATWLTIVVTTVFVFGAVVFAGNGTALAWSRQSVLYTTEMSRIAFVVGILLADICIVVQDWDFPSFNQPLEIKIAGTFETELKCNCLHKLAEKIKNIACVRRLVESDFFTVTITGKWMNFGPLMVIIGFDINMLKNQILYEPSAFGQYTDPEHRVWTIIDTEILNQNYFEGVLRENATLLDWTTRAGAGNVTDVMSNTRWMEYTMTYKVLIALPGFLALLAFILTVIFGNKYLKAEKVKKANSERIDLAEIE